MGRPTKPTALKILNGSAKHNPGRVNRAEPFPPGGAVPPPWFATDTKRRGVAWTTWHRLVPMLEAMRVLTVADAEALAVGCIALAEWRSLPWGARERPPLWNAYMNTLRDFGMTPASRSKVAMITAEPADPVEAWKAK